jgi:hypothetical protein
MPVCLRRALELPPLVSVPEAKGRHASAGFDATNFVRGQFQALDFGDESPFFV